MPQEELCHWVCILNSYTPVLSDLFSMCRMLVQCEKSCVQCLPVMMDCAPNTFTQIDSLFLQWLPVRNISQNRKTTKTAINENILSINSSTEPTWEWVMHYLMVHGMSTQLQRKVRYLEHKSNKHNK